MRNRFLQDMIPPLVGLCDLALLSVWTACTFGAQKNVPHRSFASGSAILALPTKRISIEVHNYTPKITFVFTHERRV